MIHNYLHPKGTRGDHWAVGSNEGARLVLIQLQEGNEQVRLGLELDQAESMARAILARVGCLKEIPPLASGTVSS